MKKRKPPIILVTLLVFIVGGAVAFNSSNRQTKDDPNVAPTNTPAPDPDKPMKAMGAARPIMSTTQLKTSIQGKVGGTPNAPTTPDGQPSIRVQKEAPATVDTDPNHPSAHWWENQSALGSK